ncbi:hypothetical protein ebA4852 [Aromatoleum aromaticum EbN1]|uniref:Uncharacterized protein n=1 Tax=Aromatoleum aromaticum (strain DSM 19018 / LMG 30748 / EbN1) TaxID=76114 RepID=Q5P1D4_AROAE|nr:hypothetical protein ebA4852 [Aromatoleum aromaticum EbN1]
MIRPAGERPLPTTRRTGQLPESRCKLDHPGPPLSARRQPLFRFRPDAEATGILFIASPSPLPDEPPQDPCGARNRAKSAHIRPTTYSTGRAVDILK